MKTAEENSERHARYVLWLTFRSRLLYKVLSAYLVSLNNHSIMTDGIETQIDDHGAGKAIICTAARDLSGVQCLSVPGSLVCLYVFP